MADPPLYDPDRTVWEDIDLEGLGVDERLAFIDSYLDNPVALALAEDIGRESANLPPRIQIPDLQGFLVTMRDFKREMTAAFHKQTSPEGREAFQAVIDALDRNIERAEARIESLRDEEGSEEEGHDGREVK